MSRPAERLAVAGLPLLVAGLLVAVLLWTWASRLTHPFDLEWMEGGMLAHAWRLQQGLPLYGPPSADFVPFIYPPGYPAVVALLGAPLGLSPALGRAVSIAGTLLAAAALTYAVRREGGPTWLAVGTGAVFLGTYPQAGAFYDLVRPDALGLGCMAWAVVLSLEPRRWAPLVSGLLVVAALLIKHNLAVVAGPIALVLLLRDRRDAALFVAVTAGVGLAALGALQWGSSGGLLTYLLQVPMSHDLRVWGGLLDSVREWGTALPVAMAGGGLALVWLGVRDQRTLPVPLVAAVPVGVGMVLGWLLTYFPPGPQAEVINAGGGLAGFALGAGAVAAPLWAVDRAAQVWRGSRGLPGPVATLALVLVATTAGLAWWMRAHQGGYVNVHAPFLWAACLALGLGLLRVNAAGAAGPFLASGALAAQLLWALSRLHPAALIPTHADVAAGWLTVEALRDTRGEVLSPFASWLPTYAGKPPSLHVMAVWDVDHEGGPYHEALVDLDQAVREQRWEVVLGGTQGFRPALPQYYEVAWPLHERGDRSGMPQTGWMARPERVLIPRDVPVP